MRLICGHQVGVWSSSSCSSGRFISVAKVRTFCQMYSAYYVYGLYICSRAASIETMLAVCKQPSSLLGLGDNTPGVNVSKDHPHIIALDNLSHKEIAEYAVHNMCVCTTLVVKVWASLPSKIASASGVIASKCSCLC